MGRPKGSKNLPKDFANNAETVKAFNEIHKAAVESPEENDLSQLSSEQREALNQRIDEFINDPVRWLGNWKWHGIACCYAQFSNKAIPASVNKEPVWEIKLESNDAKYKVDSISYTPHGLVFTTGDQTKLVPLSNVAYVRPI